LEKHHLKETRSRQHQPSHKLPHTQKHQRYAFSSFGKCTRGSNCEFHGPDSGKLEQEDHKKYIEILDMHERCPSDSDVKLMKRPKDAGPKRKHRVGVIEEVKN
jgi:hypothetical protein